MKKEIGAPILRVLIQQRKDEQKAKAPKEVKK
jgi:hypothetical protein